MFISPKEIYNINRVFCMVYVEVPMFPLQRTNSTYDTFSSVLTLKLNKWWWNFTLIIINFVHLKCISDFTFIRNHEPKHLKPKDVCIRPKYIKIFMSKKELQYQPNSSLEWRNLCEFINVEFNKKNKIEIMSVHKHWQLNSRCKFQNFLIKKMILDLLKF